MCVLCLNFLGGQELANIMHTLKFVESNNDSEKVGDHGKAIGILQIHNVAILDVNKHYKTSYRHKDAFNETKSERIFYYYIKLGIKLFKKKHGKPPTEQDIVRMWNGGIYSGYKNIKPIKYYKKYLKWKKVKNGSTINKF
jgi:hypothetical protein